MSKKTKATESGTEQSVDNRIGIMVPNGSPERIRSLENTPMFWRGSIRGNDGKAVQVSADCKTRQGSLRIVSRTGARLGTLSKVGNHYEGTLGKETKVRAWFQQAGEPQDKFTLRIVIGIDDGSYKPPERAQSTDVDLDAELAKLDSVRPVAERTGVPSNDSEVPF